MARQKAPTVAEKLAAAMAEAGISQRELARRMAASAEKRESMRRQIAKWLDTTKPEPPNAKRLAAELGKPADYFVTARRKRADQLAELVERMQATQARLRRLERRVDEVLKPPPGETGSGQGP